MKFDMLYEVDAPKPWSGPHPVSQRAVEQKAYREAIEQIRLADSLGFSTIAVEHHFGEVWSRCPSLETAIRKIELYADLGVDELICSMQSGYLERGNIQLIIEILGNEVIPELECLHPEARRLGVTR